MHKQSWRKVRWSTAKLVQEGMNAWLASVSINDLVISTYKTKKNSSWEFVDNCTNRKYVPTDYVLTESVQYLSLYDLILDQRLFRLWTEYVQNDNDCTKTIVSLTGLLQRPAAKEQKCIVNECSTGKHI